MGQPRRGRWRYVGGSCGVLGPGRLSERSPGGVLCRGTRAFGLAVGGGACAPPAHGTPLRWRARTLGEPVPRTVGGGYVAEPHPKMAPNGQKPSEDDGIAGNGERSFSETFFLMALECISWEL